MSKRSYKLTGKRGEEGYALLLVVFLTTMLLLATMVAAPSVKTERKREKEEEAAIPGPAENAGRLFARLPGAGAPSR